MLHHYEATHMNSSEGEKVQFKAPVRLEGVVEGWLCVVENMMHKSLRDVLRACRLDLKKHLSKREKWVRDWPGQVIITASQIQWTADCEKALDRGDKKGLKSIRKKQTSSNNVQEIIEGKVEKRTKGIYVYHVHVHAHTYMYNPHIRSTHIFRHTYSVHHTYICIYVCT
jgi:dynein heavy chain